MINILGLEIELDSRMVGMLVFCRLDLKMKSLHIYRIAESGKFILAKKMFFLVRNVDYH